MHLDDASLASTCIFITLTQIFLHDPKSIDRYTSRAVHSQQCLAFSQHLIHQLGYSHIHPTTTNRESTETGYLKHPYRYSSIERCALITMDTVTRQLQSLLLSLTALDCSLKSSPCIIYRYSESDVRIADTTWTWNYINKCKLQQSQMTKNGRESVKFNSERLLWSDNVVAIPYLSHSKPRDCT